MSMELTRKYGFGQESRGANRLPNLGEGVGEVSYTEKPVSVSVRVSDARDVHGSSRPSSPPRNLNRVWSQFSSRSSHSTAVGR